MRRYAIGIDTGGTYTDAAIIDMRDHRILAAAKALTTRGDLAIGVGEALRAAVEAAGGGLIGEIGRVALSTTLATNALVEGRGGPVGVLLIGFDQRMAERARLGETLPGAAIFAIGGGHDHSGQEQAPLDEAAVAAAIAASAGRVEAYAVAAQYSVRNPAHEARAAAMIRAATGKPVSTSADLAQALDAPRRALTAALNASIVAAIVHLVAAVRQEMAALGIKAQLMIVKGDGALADAGVIVEKPIETILSGPAASVIGARFLSGLDDFIIADVGGTTTDVATVAGGWPKLNREGAVVGSHRTLVRAIDMRTIGLGGDSEVEIDAENRVALRRTRQMPLSLLGARWPATVAQMRLMLEDPEAAAHGGRFVLRPIGADPAAAPADLDAAERDALARIGAEPVALHRLPQAPPFRRALGRLAGRGLLIHAGYTPSDAAHVLGLQGQWSREAAELGGQLLVKSRRMLRMDARASVGEAFAAEVFDAVARASCHVVMETAAGEALEAGHPLVAAVTSGRGALGRLAVGLRPQVPLVGVGGPAAVFYPEVARRLGCELVVPERAAVANAIGAAVGVVRARATVEISANGAGLFRLHHAGPPVDLADPGEALARARSLAIEEATARARADGAEAGADLTIELHVDRIDVPDARGDSGLVAATVIAECRVAG